MKKRIALCFIMLNMLTLHSQNDSLTNNSMIDLTNQLKPKEAIAIAIDTTIENSFIKQGAQLIVSSLFGESRKLSNADSIINRFDALPSFGIYKDNYIVIGTEMLSKPTKFNSDSKFQVSIRHRITNSTLPFKTYLFLTYTQKVFWGVFQDSFPFTDLNFNPSIGLGRALIYNNRYLGRITFQFEHESNGKDGIDSRSWNKLTFGSNLILNDNWKLDSKIWIPIVDGQNNKDIVKYAGYANIGLHYFSSNKKYGGSFTYIKRGGTNLNANIVLNFSARLFSDDTQFLFLELYNGYGESFYEYKQFRHRARIGIAIRPDFFNIF